MKKLCYKKKRSLRIDNIDLLHLSIFVKFSILFIITKNFDQNQYVSLENIIIIIANKKPPHENFLIIKSMKLMKIKDEKIASAAVAAAVRTVEI